MPDYLDVVYNSKIKPYTSYPHKLVSYLFHTIGMKEGMSLLEPGVGRGEHLRIFKDFGIKVKGLDISPKSLEMSPDLNIDIFNADDNHWPYKDNCFDIVYSKSFIEHLRNPEMYFSEAFRVLNPGGVLLTLTPDWEANYKKFFDDYTHISPFTIVSLSNIQKASGFNEVKVYKIRQLPIVWKFPVLNYFCSAISPFIPVRTITPFFRWSRELLLVGIGRKPKAIK
jgi:ubiquinone/menaquinone biosynthesis C-methylase UbiE